MVKEILNFYQDDLDVDDVFILDGGDEIYVWEGVDCSDEEKEKSMQLASVRSIEENFFRKIVNCFSRLTSELTQLLVRQNPCLSLPFSKVRNREASNNSFRSGKTIFGSEKSHEKFNG